MPRITVSLAVLVAVGFSIGLNIHRYGVVWEMAGSVANPAAQPPISPAEHRRAVLGDGAPSGWPEPAARPSNRVPEPIAVCQTEIPPARPPSPQASQGSRIDCTGDSCGLVGDDASTKRGEGHLAPPRPEKPLVPLVKYRVGDTIPSGEAGSHDLAGASGNAPTEPRVQRLPPVDREWPAPVTADAPLRDGTIPLYATTVVH